VLKKNGHWADIFKRGRASTVGRDPASWG
jgi:hypothetical protein